MATADSYSGAAVSGSWLPAIFTDYYTTKTVVLRSPHLQVPNLCLQVVIAFYIVIYSLGYNLRFMGSEEVDADVDITVLKPMSNWATCSSTDFDCNLDVGDPGSYCKNHTPFGVVYKHGVKHQRRVERCWKSDVHIAPSNKVLVPTLLSFLYQTWNGTHGDWMTDDVKEYYMQDIEAFVLRFRHSFVTQASGIKKSSINMDGVLSSEAGEYKFARGPFLEEFQDKNHQPDPWSTIQELDTCGLDPSQARDQSTSCSRTLWGNVMSVKKLLNFSGIQSLDDARRGMNGATYRQSGLGLSIDINYRNDVSVWERFFLDGFSIGSLLSPPPFYTLRIDREPMAADFVVKSLVTYPTKNGTIDLNRRLIEQQTGIQVRVTAGGSVCFASGRQLLLSAVSALALLSLAHILVERCLVRIYRKVTSMHHISAMYNMHKHEGSATDMQFRSELEVLKVDDNVAYHHLLDFEVSPTNTKSIMKNIQKKLTSLRTETTKTSTTTERKRPQNNDNDDHGVDSYNDDATHKRNKDDDIKNDSHDNDDRCLNHGSDHGKQQRQPRQPPRTTPCCPITPF